MSDLPALEQQLIAEFSNTLRSEAQENLSELENEMPLATDASLAVAILGRLEEAGAVADYELCPHEDISGQRRSKIVAYSLPEDSTRLELFTVHAGGSDKPSMLASSEIGRVAGRAARFFDYSIRGDLERFSSSSAALAAVRRIGEEASRIQEVRIHILTDCFARDRNVDDLEMQGRFIEFEVWDLERLYRTAGEEVTRDRIELDFTQLIGRPIACLEMKPPPKEYQTFLLVLPGNVVFQLYERFGARLFEFNVRSFLQAKGKVNAGIRKTIETEPERFLAYNNGMTATADEIEVGEWHGETVIHRLKGLQIVNGAQTTASIHRAKKIDKLDISNLAVAMKLTRVEPSRLSEFVPRIAEYANTQNPIQMADLQASSKFHQVFEDLSQQIWCPGEETRWFFERARGSYQVARMREGTTQAKRRDFDLTYPKSQHFGKAELAKYLMTWDGRPDSVSKGAQKNHSTFLAGLKDRFGDDWTPDHVFYKDTISKALIFKAAQAVVKKAKLQSYGANVVTYMVAKLAAKYGAVIDLNHVWSLQETSGALRTLFADWAPKIHAAIVETAEKRNVTEWCKKEACWEAIRALDLSVPEDRPEEFTAGSQPTKASADDPADAHANPNKIVEALVNQCITLDAQSWAAVMLWVASSTEIDEFDRKVAHTLSGYAMDGWQKHPSEKQAIRGARVVAAARAAGVLG